MKNNKTCKLVVRLTQSEHQMLEELTNRFNKPMSEIVRKMIEQTYKRNRPLSKATEDVIIPKEDTPQQVIQDISQSNVIKERQVSEADWNKSLDAAFNALTKEQKIEAEDRATTLKRAERKKTLYNKLRRDWEKQGYSQQDIDDNIDAAVEARLEQEDN